MQFPVEFIFEPLGIESIDIWQGQFLGNDVACDFETTVEPFHTMDHKPVVFQAFAGTNTIYLVRLEDLPKFWEIHTDSNLIFHNAPFDLWVADKHFTFDVWDKFNKDLYTDTALLFKLWGLAVIGKIPKSASLKDASKMILGLDVDKNHEVRTGFGPYLNKPYEELPLTHITYASLDVAYTYYLNKKLNYLISPIDKYNTLLTHSTQIKGAMALRYLDCIGIRVNLAERDSYLRALQDNMWGLNMLLSTYGVFKGQPGVEQAYNAAIEYLGLTEELPKTDTLKVTKSRKELQDWRHIEFIDAWCKYTELEKIASFLVNLDEETIYPQYNPLLVTGRTSCSGKKTNCINIQQLPREGSVRELFIPREGKIFVDVDYDAIELSTFAYTQYKLLGTSKMGDIINSGKDIHTATAASMYNKDAGKCTKKDMGQVSKAERQSAKLANFGLLANMHEETFKNNAKAQGTELSLKEARDTKNKWLGVYPDIEDFFRLPFDNKDGGEYWCARDKKYKSTYSHYTLTGRKRGGVKYTEWLNHHFQGLASDGLKLALFNLVKGGYSVVAEVHDNITVEVDIKDAEKELYNICKIMVDSMSEVIPGIRVGVEGRVVNHLGKSAEELFTLNYNNLTGSN